MSTYVEGLRNQGGLVQTLRWADFLAVVQAKGLAMQYAALVDQYQVFAVDGPLTYQCTLIFASASANYPFPMSDGYTAAQNNTDVGTFTGTYQAGANTVALSSVGNLTTTAPISGDLVAAVDTSGFLQALNITAATTAATAAQRGLVVSVSPNSIASVSGTHAAGSPGTLALTIQGISGGTAVPVSGTITATNPSVGATGSAVPADATYVGGLDPSGNLAGPGIAPASTAAIATQPSLVTALSPNTPLPAGTNTIGSINAINTAVTVAQSTAANLLATVTQGTSPWVENLTQVGGSAIALGQTTMSASLPVTLASNQSTLAVQTPDSTATGALAADNATLSLAAGDGQSSAVINLAGTFSAGSTVSFLGTIDGTNYFPIFGSSVSSSSISLVSSVSGGAAPYEYRVDVAGLAGIQVKVHPFNPGDSITTTLRMSIGTPAISAAAAAGTVTANQGSPNTLANAWPVEITDGTSVLGTGANPIRIDPTGTTTQPVSGTVAVTQSTSPWIVAGGGTAGSPGTAVLTVQGISGGTAIPVSGTFASASVGLTGSTAPTSADEIGGVDTSGNLQHIGATLTGAAASTTQQALVVALSPNSPLPAGSNALGSVTVTGTVAVTQSTSPWVTSISTALPAGTNTIGAVTIAGSTSQPTYRAVAANLVTAANPTDIFTLQGSATKTIRITRLQLSGTQSSAGNLTAFLIKRSAANTAGTSSTITIAKMNSGDAAATAVAKSYTVNPTALGASAGTLEAIQVFTPDGTGDPDATVLTFGGLEGNEAITLNGTSEYLVLNLNGVTLSAGSVNVSVEWTES